MAPQIVVASPPMRRTSFSAVTVLSCLVLAACGGSSADSAPGGAGGEAGGGQGGQGGSGGVAPTITFECPAGAQLTSGLNQGFAVGAQTRKFYVDYPSDTSHPLPVVFSWHGFGDTAANFRNLLDANGDPSFPFILVTPESTQLFPPAGMEWEIFNGAASAANGDAALFEAVLGCLAKSSDVDATRIYSIGFSAGAIFTNLMHSRYPHVLAATLAYSGAWFDDQAEVAKVNTLGLSVNFDWDALVPADGGTVVVTHGGVNDAYGLNASIKIIDFEQSTALAVPFLKDGGRTVVSCAHKNGHQPHPQVGPDMVTHFFHDHTLGAPSPYATSGLDGSWPASCTLE